jgi:hypothetical protein
MIGVTNDEMVFHGFHGENNSKKARIYNRTKAKMDKIFFIFSDRSTR